MASLNKESWRSLKHADSLTNKVTGYQSVGRGSVPDGSYAFFSSVTFRPSSGPIQLLGTLSVGVNRLSLVPKLRRSGYLTPHPKSLHCMLLRHSGNFSYIGEKYFVVYTKGFTL